MMVPESSCHYFPLSVAGPENPTLSEDENHLPWSISGARGPPEVDIKM